MNKSEEMKAMELKSYLEYVNSGKTIHAPSEELAYSGYLTQEALKITAVMNSGYHEPEELQELFANLTGQEINRTLGLIPPFYTDCGKNIHYQHRMHHAGSGRRVYRRRGVDRASLYDRNIEP